MSSRPGYLRQLVRVESMGRGLRRLLFGVTAAVVLYALVLGEGGLLRLRSLRGENERLAQQISWLRGETASLESSLEHLQVPESLALERVARERYGMLRPGERVVHVLGVEAPPGPTPPAAPRP